MLEAAIFQLIEDSMLAQNKGEYRLALDKAKESVNKERSLIRQKEQLSMIEPNNDLNFSVILWQPKLQVNLQSN